MFRTITILLLMAGALFLTGPKDAEALATPDLYVYEYMNGSTLTYDVSLEPGYPGLKVQAVLIGAKPDNNGNYGTPSVAMSGWRATILDVSTWDDPPNIQLYYAKLPEQDGGPSSHLFKNVSFFYNEQSQTPPWPDWAGYEKAYLFWNDGKNPAQGAIANGTDGQFTVTNGTYAAGAPFVETWGLLTVSANWTDIRDNGMVYDQDHQTWNWKPGWQVYDAGNNNDGYTANGGGYTHPIPQNGPVVPIPGSLLLLAPGLLGAVGLRRRLKG